MKTPPEEVTITVEPGSLKQCPKHPDAEVIKWNCFGKPEVKYFACGCAWESYDEQHQWTWKGNKMKTPPKKRSVTIDAKKFNGCPTHPDAEATQRKLTERYEVRWFACGCYWKTEDHKHWIWEGRD